MKLAAVAIVLAGSATQAQVRPLDVTSMSVLGSRRGTTATVVLSGTNLKDANAVVFDDPRITMKIVRVASPDSEKGEKGAKPEPSSEASGGRPQTWKVTAEVNVPVDVSPGLHKFRIGTPLGTTRLLSWAVGALQEVVEESDATPAKAQPLTQPVLVNGALQTPGDIDYFALEVRSAETVVIDVASAGVGSQMDSTLELHDASGAVVARNDDRTWQTRDSRIVHRCERGGTYTIKIADATARGNTRDRNDFAYRLSVTTPENPALNIDREGTASSVESFVGSLSPRYVQSEVLERAALSGAATGQPVSSPVTIKGTIERRPDGSSEDRFRFRARKGEKLVFSVAAGRVGSPLDAVIDVLDKTGSPVPRAVLQALWETRVDVQVGLLGPGSINAAWRLLSVAELRRGDYLFVDRELIQVDEALAGDDLNLRLVDFRGWRNSYQGTSGAAHGAMRPVYKVEILPPGTKATPNGLPRFELVYRNDDGGPLYGNDPYLDFTSPADGEYLVRVADTRGAAGDSLTYRLIIAPPRPDFALFVSPENPNVPLGGSIPVTVFAFRHDGFDEPIEVALTGLPEGFEAAPGVILPGHSSVALKLSARRDASAVSGNFGVKGQARVAGEVVTHSANIGVPVASTVGSPELHIASVEPSEIELKPGERVPVRVTIARAETFKGDVRLEVLNLPSGVTIAGVDQNSGITLSKTQNVREFQMEADARTQALGQTLCVTARPDPGGSPQACALLKLRVVTAAQPSSFAGFASSGLASSLQK